MSLISEVRKDREELARVLKRHVGIRKIVEDLYPDKAHFIYELLQNAEDRNATAVRFDLGPQKLRFEHNGESFRAQDISAITDIGEGTKAADDDKIGRFGVGFKAVFAYSETPHIWSPTFSFKISELVLPDELPSASDLRGHTRFDFPFDNPKKAPHDAVSEIEAGFGELAETTLLFLRHIESIKWTVAGGSTGELLRVDHKNGHIEILKVLDGNRTASFHFLKFDRPVEGLASQNVAVAYVLDFLPGVSAFSSSKPLSQQLRIVPARGQVAVFFPAGKETSGLRFHLHAPFVPELSRASIKETPVNKPLFDQLAKLTASSLHAIRDHGLLTPDFLGVLPNTHDALGPRYEGIRKAIVDAMDTEPLTPTYAKGHAPANILVQARSALKDLLTHDDIKYLIGYPDEPLQWAAPRTLQGTNTERFMNQLGIQQWDVEEFVNCIHERANTSRWNGVNAEFMKWLGDKDIDWHQQFYALLARENDAQIARHRLQSCKIVRLNDGHYSVASNCHFGYERGLNTDGVACVDPAVYTAGKSKTQQESARKFLEDMGVTDVGERQLIDAILRTSYGDDKRTLNERDYLTHMRRFIKYLDEDTSAASQFSRYPLFMGKDSRWHRAEAIYLDAPYLETGLAEYLGLLGATNKLVPLADFYESLPIDTVKIARFAEALGAATRIGIANVSCTENPDWGRLATAPGERNASPINRDYAIIRFKQLVERKSVRLAKLVWDTMCRLADTDHPYDASYFKNPLRAVFRRTERGGPRFADSQLVHQLRNEAWIPQQGADFVKPAAARAELLPGGFTFDAGWPWIKAIHFGRDILQEAVVAQAAATVAIEYQRRQQEAAKALGFDDAETARSVAQIPAEELKRFRAEWERRKTFDLPDQTSRNPDRRSANVMERAADAPERRTEERTRSVSVGREAVKAESDQYLRQQYTKADGDLICQICEDVLPFKLDDGTFYFETVELLSAPDLQRRHYQNYICLCPNHAAMFQHVNRSKGKLKQSILCQTENKLGIVLAQQAVTIYLTRIHLADMQAIIRADELERATCNGTRDVEFSTD